MVEILGEVFGRNNEGNFIRVRSQHILSKLDPDETCGAAHTAQIVCHNILAHFEAIHYHGTKGRCRREEAAVHYEDVNLGRQSSSAL
jgi:hypothetical protein